MRKQNTITMRNMGPKKEYCQQRTKKTALSIWNTVRNETEKAFSAVLDGEIRNFFRNY